MLTAALRRSPASRWLAALAVWAMVLLGAPSAAPGAGGICTTGGAPHHHDAVTCSLCCATPAAAPLAAVPPALPLPRSAALDTSACEATPGAKASSTRFSWARAPPGIA